MENLNRDARYHINISLSIRRKRIRWSENINDQGRTYVNASK